MLFNRKQYYSPDFNPIEEVFSKTEGLLRKVEARDRESLVEVVGKALDAVGAQDAKGSFKHRGYRQAVQLP